MDVAGSGDLSQERTGFEEYYPSIEAVLAP
jgi:hypothetical protein